MSDKNYTDDELYGGANSNNEIDTTIQTYIDNDTADYGDIVIPTKNLIVNNKSKRLFGKPMVIYIKDSETNEKDEDLTKIIDEIRDYNDFDKLVLENEKQLSFNGKTYFKVDNMNIDGKDKILLNFTPYGNHISHNNNNNFLSKVDININIGGGSTYYQVYESYTNNKLARTFKKITDGKASDITQSTFTSETQQVAKKQESRKGIPIVVFENIPTLAGNGLSDFADTKCIETSLQISWNRLNENALLIKPRIGWNGKVPDNATLENSPRMKLLKSKGILMNNQDAVSNNGEDTPRLAEPINVDSNISEADIKDFNKKRDLLFEQAGRRRTIDTDKGAQQTSYQVSQSRDNEKITDDDFIRRRAKDYKKLIEIIFKTLNKELKNKEVVIEIEPNYTVDDNALIDFYSKAIAVGVASKEQAHAHIFRISIDDAKSAIKEIQKSKEKDMKKQAELNPVLPEQNTDQNNLNNKSASVSKPNERTPKNEQDTKEVSNERQE